MARGRQREREMAYPVVVRDMIERLEKAHAGPRRWDSLYTTIERMLAAGEDAELVLELKDHVERLETLQRIEALADEQALVDQWWESQGLEVDDEPALRGQRYAGAMVWLYHGTSDAVLHRIEREGILARPPVRLEDRSVHLERELDCVFLTSSPTEAHDWYAVRAARSLGGHPVVLRVLVPWDELEPDPDDAVLACGKRQFVLHRDVEPSEIMEIGGERMWPERNPATARSRATGKNAPKRKSTKAQRNPTTVTMEDIVRKAEELSARWHADSGPGNLYRHQDGDDYEAWNDMVQQESQWFADDNDIRPLSCGSSRCAFDMGLYPDGGPVIKLTIDGSPWSNLTEAKRWKAATTEQARLLAPVVAFDSGGAWLVMELADTHMSREKLWDITLGLDTELRESGFVVKDIHVGNVGVLAGRSVAIDYTNPGRVPAKHLAGLGRKMADCKKGPKRKASKAKRKSATVTMEDIVRKAEELSARWHADDGPGDLRRWDDDGDEDDDYDDKLYRSFHAFARENKIKPLACGESRCVFDMGLYPEGGPAIKLTVDGSPDSNINEADLWERATTEQARLLAPVVASDPGGAWLVMELADTEIVFEEAGSAAMDLQKMLHESGLYLLDIHGSNIGTVDGRLVAIDYGEVDVIGRRGNPGRVPEKYLAGLGPKEAARRKREIAARKKESSSKASSYRPFRTDRDASGKNRRTRPSRHTRAYKRKWGVGGSVSQVARETGIPTKVLRDVYNRGLAAWRTGHRPGATQHQWAMARVYSFATGGPTWNTADADLAKLARRAGFDPHRAANPGPQPPGMSAELRVRYQMATQPGLRMHYWLDFSREVPEIGPVELEALPAQERTRVLELIEAYRVAEAEAMEWYERGEPALAEGADVRATVLAAQLEHVWSDLVEGEELTEDMLDDPRQQSWRVEPDQIEGLAVWYWQHLTGGIYGPVALGGYVAVIKESFYGPHAVGGIPATPRDDLTEAEAVAGLRAALDLRLSHGRPGRMAEAKATRRDLERKSRFAADLQQFPEEE